MADVGTGTQVTFATSGFAAELLSVNGQDIARDEIETSHMGTVGYKTFMPADLIDPGAVDLEFAFDPDERPPVEQPPEQITITFPVPPGKSNGARVQGIGFISQWSWGAEVGAKMTGSAKIKWSGSLNWFNAT